jgi:hypothetical protein
MLDRSILYYGLVTLVMLTFSQIPSLTVSIFMSKEIAALYFAAFNIASILLLFSAAQIQQIMPEMIKQNYEQLIDGIEKKYAFYI